MLPTALLTTLAMTALCLPCAPAARAQDPVSTLKRQIDGLVKEVAQDPPKTATGAAKFLIAAVRCPRRYDLSDGPFMRGPKDLLMKARRNNGLFGSGDANEVRETTAWAWQALSELDEAEFAEVLETTR
ncbi:MAG: hypothetical protein R3F30_16235, partial [Planctomycetota bacterium]